MANIFCLTHLCLSCCLPKGGNNACLLYCSPVAPVYWCRLRKKSRGCKKCSESARKWWTIINRPISSQKNPSSTPRSFLTASIPVFRFDIHSLKKGSEEQRKEGITFQSILLHTMFFCPTLQCQPGAGKNGTGANSIAKLYQLTGDLRSLLGAS